MEKCKNTNKLYWVKTSRQNIRVWDKVGLTHEERFHLEFISHSFQCLNGCCLADTARTMQSAYIFALMVQASKILHLWVKCTWTAPQSCNYYWKTFFKPRVSQLRACQQENIFVLTVNLLIFFLLHVQNTIIFYSAYIEHEYIKI